MPAKSTSAPSSIALSLSLWIVQALLALLFLFAGAMKLVMPLEVLAEQVPLPGLIVRIIGTLEVLGAIGLILPALLRIRPRLTELAAACVALEMVVATIFSVLNFGAAMAVLPLVAGVLAAGVAYGRFRLGQQSAPSRSSVLHMAS